MKFGDTVNLMRHEAEVTKARSVLEKAIGAVKGAETLIFAARRLHTSDLVQKMYLQLKAPVPFTFQRYYSSNRIGMSHRRVESTVDFDGMSLTTVCIKNRDGIWDVLHTCACEISTIFSPDELLGIFPFIRLISALQYPYELSVDEPHIDMRKIALNGRLGTKPPHCEEDIASEFSYTMNKTDGHLYSLCEKTFVGRSFKLEFDSLLINCPVDEGLFELPKRHKIVMSDKDEYLNIRNKEWITMSKPI